MNKTIAVVVSLLIAGFVMYTLRRGAQDARNERAIERIHSGNKVRPDVRPRSTDGRTQGGAVRQRG